MVNNVELVSSVYSTGSGVLKVDPELHLANDKIARRGESEPRDLRGWMANSAAGLVACCYIDALGKVLRENKPRAGDENLRRFKLFVRRYMPDLAAENRRRGGKFSARTLYKTYRCGFVHQFADPTAAWLRRGRSGRYWYQYKGRPAINVDRLASGTRLGIETFQNDFRDRVLRGEITYGQFLSWLGV